MASAREHYYMIGLNHAMFRPMATRFSLLILSALVLVAGLMIFIPPQPAEAASPVTQFAAACSEPPLLGIPAWNAYLSCGDNGEIVDFSFPAHLWLVAIAFLEILIKLAAYIAALFIIYGGVSMIISQGNPEKIGNAKGTIEQAVVGLGIAVLSVAILKFVESAVTPP